MVTDSLVFELKRCLQRARLNPVRGMVDWVGDFVIADGPNVGEPFRFETQPITKLLIEEIDSRRWNEVFITGPSQSGKTLIGFVAPALYHTLELGETYVLGIPDMRMANNKWQMDLLPAIKANVRWERLLPLAGPGSQGGIVRDTITFRNGGVLKFMSANGSDQARAGFTSRVVGITEAARFSRVSETSREADPLRQMRARQAAYDEPQRMLYVEGTVTVEEDLPWSAKSDSSDSKIMSRCPHCGDWIAPERENLLGWQDCINVFEAGEMAVWCCSMCGEGISESERRESVSASKLVHAGQTINRRGQILGPMPKTNRLFFRYSGWHNLFVTTSTLAKEEWRADQIDKETTEYENAQKELTQFKWAIPYKSNNLESQPLDKKEVLKRRAEAYPRGLLPPKTTHLTLGCDVGKYSLHYFVLAGLSSGMLHCPAYGMIDVPSAFMDWEQAIAHALNELFELCEVGWTLQGSSQPRLIDQAWIDTGYEPDAIFKAVIAHSGRPSRRSRYQMALGRGSGQMQRMYQAPPKRGGGIVEIGHHWHTVRNKRWKTFQIFADSDHWKDRLQDSFKQPKDKPGAITLYHAPEREHDRLSKHITNEHRKVEFVPGEGEKVKFEKKGANHWLDAAYNARAALDRIGWRPELVDKV
jgi:phage terminase large subunit GpA-like protein